MVNLFSQRCLSSSIGKDTFFNQLFWNRYPHAKRLNQNLISYRVQKVTRVDYCAEKS